MENKIFQIILKHPSDRTISESISLLQFWSKSDPREFAFGSMCENFFNKEDKTKIHNG